MKKSISRREFLRESLAAAGLTVAVVATPFGFELVNASEDKGKGFPRFKPCAWFEIAPDEKVTVAVPNSEMGQGVRTALPMIVADELDADWGRVHIVQAPAAEAFKNPLLHSQLTVASASVRGFYDPLRKAGAAGRAMLIKAAAAAWNVPEAECETFKGTIKHPKSGRSVAYGRVCLAAAKLQVPKAAPLKQAHEYRYIGKAMPRVDIPEKVSGVAVFGLDVNVPDMLYAVLARPPAYGATPVSYDQKAAEKVGGVRCVVQTPTGIAVCGETIDAALKGRDALAVKWGEGSHPRLNSETLEKSLREDLDRPGAEAFNRGDVEKAMGDAGREIEATYFVPCVAHATMEPMNCTAHVQKDRCDVWVPTQGQTIAQMFASKFSGLPAERVHIHTTLLGCGFGRRSDPRFVVEAVVASKAAGRPVKVVWTREEDFKHDPFRAATCQRVHAGLDGEGRLVGWSHKVACLSILKHLNPKGIRNGIDMYTLWGLVDSPDSPHVNNRIMYEIPNLRIEERLSDLPVPAFPWRSVQNAPNAFVVESFIDELAHAAGKDPLEFRLGLLKRNMRPRRVLETVAEKAGWGKPLAEGRGRGIAQHACFGSYVAQVAEVSVNKRDGSVKVHRVVAAVDCGPVINPDPLVAQIEGAIVMGLSTALKEKVEFAKGGVKSANFDDYGLLRMSETPEIEVHVVKSDESIGGIGEPGVTPVAPAVANAVFDAAGVRIRRMPFEPETVLAALKAREPS